MAQDSKDIEQFLSVGSVVMFHTDVAKKGSPRYRTVVRGWRKGVHIMMDRPRTEQDGMVALIEGQLCVVRYLFNGQACAFNAMVLDWDTRRHSPYVRVAWPDSVQFVAFRRFERITLNEFCEIRCGTGVKQSEIVDLSLGGCGLVSPVLWEKGAELSISFTLPDGAQVQGVNSVVRSVRKDRGGFFLGCQFVEGQDSVENDIAFYVTNLVARQRGGEGEPQSNGRVLVIDNTESGPRIKQLLAERGVEAALAHDAVEGLARLHMWKPEGLAVSAVLTDLDGPGICSLIRRNENYAELPVFVYGGEESCSRIEAENAGATAYIPPKMGMSLNVAKQVGEHLGITGNLARAE